MGLAEQPSQRHRNGQNVFAGWCFGIGVVVFILFMDPLFVINERGRSTEDTLTVLLPFTLGAALISTGGYCLFASSSVEVTSGHVVLRNALREHRIPRAGLQVESLSMGFPTLLYAGAKLTAWGAEDRAPDLADAAEPAASTGGAVVTNWRKPDRVATGLLMFWSAYLLAGLVWGWPRG